MGRDGTYSYLTVREDLFLSARPRGTRLSSSEPVESISSCFYPRVRVGRDNRAAKSDRHSICFYPRVRVGRDF